MIAINQIFPISFETWMGMDDLLKKAIALEVEEIARKRQNERSRQEAEAEKMVGEQASKVKFPSAVQSSISRFFT